MGNLRECGRRFELTSLYDCSTEETFFQDFRASEFLANLEEMSPHYPYKIVNTYEFPSARLQKVNLIVCVLVYGELTSGQIHWNEFKYI